MSRISPLIFCFLGLLPVVLPASARAADAVIAEPDYAFAGQAVTLRWYFTGTKVVLSGGRFGAGVVVTGKTSVVDHPKKTTRYTFDVFYQAPVTSSSTGDQTIKPEHVTYTVVAEVDPTPPPAVTTYRDPHGWQIDYLAGWRRDISTPDTGNEGLIFFQKELDSVERLAVSVMPAGDMTNEVLISKVRADIPAHYTDVNIVTENDLPYANMEARWLIFHGMDDSHPDIRTESIVLALIHNGRAYVVSARTTAAHYKNRRAVLQLMLKSFKLAANVSGTNAKSSSASLTTSGAPKRP